LLAVCDHRCGSGFPTAPLAPGLRGAGGGTVDNPGRSLASGNVWQRRCKSDLRIWLYLRKHRLWRGPRDLQTGSIDQQQRARSRSARKIMDDRANGIGTEVVAGNLEAARTIQSPPRAVESAVELRRTASCSRPRRNGINPRMFI
jgi:hypothetical protein